MSHFKTLIPIGFIYPSSHSLPGPPRSRLSDSPPRLRLAFAVFRDGFLAWPHGRHFAAWAIVLQLPQLDNLENMAKFDAFLEACINHAQKGIEPRGAHF